ncbi:chitobiase-like isoform X2 [Liolophura sinensis]|uniref:chitobiase-like isoform X2 n=1 Tax=Liolophura sinensis TaxID=3198878 RepID=UPI00315812A1
MDQKTLNDIAENLGVLYEVLDNISDGRKTFRACLTLTNNSNKPLKAGRWGIYFCHVRMIEPDVLPDEKYVLIPEAQVKISHINGCLFVLEPARYFKTLEQGCSLKISFKGQYYSVAKTDVMPNWYFAAEGCYPALIQSTVDETLGFVADFDTPLKWKRFDYSVGYGRRIDAYNPYTAGERYEKNARADGRVIAQMVIPTPLHLSKREGKFVTVTTDKWVISCTSHSLVNEAKYLAEKTLLPVDEGHQECRRATVHLELCDTATILSGRQVTGLFVEEAYQIRVSAEDDQVTIQGTNPAGVFYGIQTFLSLWNPDGRVPEVKIQDAPRFPYRGMHIDVVRNFHSVRDIKLLLETMAMYKLNKLHFHLTDDEGWRLEIPGLEELTQIGGKTGHDLSETKCILPVLGSGPEIRSAFYSIEEYRDLLLYAKLRHIEIIPEIDMPGHAHAAIKTMQLRQDRLKEMGRKFEDYTLVGKTSGGDHLSVQKYVNNAIDPGLESTYAFVRKVISELISLHANISPLRSFHFGGDEVPTKSWRDYQACQKLLSEGIVDSEEDLMEYFVKRVAEVAAECNVDLSAWQDAVLFDDGEMIERHDIPSKEVTVYAWLNRWEVRLADSGNRLANSGYKVVMAQGTHLYFDHPYEPDPNERGLYWATRYIDTFKTFSFMPLNLLGNCDEKLSGEPITDEDLETAEKVFERLEKPENVIAYQVNAVKF